MDPDALLSSAVFVVADACAAGNIKAHRHAGSVDSSST